MGAAHSLTLSHAVHIKYYLINWRTRYALLLKFVRTTIVYTILSVIGIFFSTANTKIGNENSGDYILAIRNMLQIFEAVPLPTPSDDNKDELSDNSGLEESCSKHKIR